MLFLKSTLLGCLDSGRSNGQGIRLVLLLVKKRIHDKLSYASASLARSSHSDTRHNFWKARPARLLFSTCWWKFTVIWISPAGFWATSRQLSPFSNHAYFVCLVASGYPHVLCGMSAFGHTCCNCKEWLYIQSHLVTLIIQLKYSSLKGQLGCLLAMFWWWFVFLPKATTM